MNGGNYQFAVAVKLTLCVYQLNRVGLIMKCGNYQFARSLVAITLTPSLSLFLQSSRICVAKVTVAVSAYHAESPTYSFRLTIEQHLQTLVEGC